MSNRLREVRKSLDLTLDEAAKKIGTSNQMLGMLERGDRQLTQRWLEQIAPAYKINPADLLEARPTKTQKISIVGFVGAGAEAHFYGNGDNPNEETDAAPGSNEKTVAVEIRGTSLGPMFDKALVFYDEKRDPPTPDMLRKLCVVGLTDGRVLIKQLLNGSIVGKFHLLSQTEGMIENAALEWAAIVRAIVPR
jgi:transcriptional regulator with XRE-family HTH domain